MDEARKGLGTDNDDTDDDQGPCKVSFAGLTCGYGGQRPRSSLLSRRCAPHLHGEHLTQAQVGATWRSVSGRDGPESAPDRSLSTPASEQVNRPSDDFARALGRRRVGGHSPTR
jgi:hypothetical protein